MKQVSNAEQNKITYHEALVGVKRLGKFRKDSPENTGTAHADSVGTDDTHPVAYIFGRKAVTKRVELTNCRTHFPYCKESKLVEKVSKTIKNVKNRNLEKVNKTIKNVT